MIVLHALVAIKLIKRKPKSAKPPPVPTEREPLLAADPSTQTTDSTEEITSRKISSPSFDLGLARLSIIIEFVGYLIICFIPTSTTFVIVATLNAAASGLWPALRSVALELYSKRGGTESGRLFGGLSVIYALWCVLSSALRSSSST